MATACVEDKPVPCPACGAGNEQPAPGHLLRCSCGWILHRTLDGCWCKPREVRVSGGLIVIHTDTGYAA